MKTKLVIAVVLTAFSVSASAQNYTSLANGAWTTAANWNNTDGWGASTPPTNGGHGSGTITLNHNMSISGSYNTGSAVLNLASGKSLNVNGVMTVGGGSNVNITGSLTINGDLTLNGTLKILPGGTVTVSGNTTINSSNFLIVGTNAAAPLGPFASLVVGGDLKQRGSGDVTLNKNARVAVFGDVTDGGGGGTFLKLNQGAQMYVDGKIAYTGGGNDIINSNSSSPYGLYVNETTTNTGGGASTTSNKANKATMDSTNPTLSAWVASVGNALMPVTLLFFEVSDVNRETVVLKWATASEENFDYFIVESSMNGVDFTEAGRVLGNGTTKVRHDYTFEIVNPAVGKTYFRLKSVDFDSYTETFKMISVTREAEKSVKIFPNPVADSKMNIDFNFDPSEEVFIVITDLTGHEVFRGTINEMENLLILSIEPGYYVVRIQSSEITSTCRVQVL